MPQTNAHRILKNSVYMFIRMAIVLILGLYTSRLVLQALGFDDYGIYNVVGSIVFFFSFLQNALGSATSRYITFDLGVGDRDKLSKTFTMAVYAHLILAGIMILVLETGGIWFVNHKLNIPDDRMTAVNWCFQFSLLSMALNVMAIPFSSNIVAHERMDYYAIVSIIEALLKLGVAFLLLAAPIDKLILYSALLLVVTVIIRLMYIIYCFKFLKDCKLIHGFYSTQLKQFATFSGYSLLVSSTDGISMQSRNIFFNWFSGVLANAAMGITNQVMNILNGFVDSFTQAIKPQIIKSYATGDRPYLMRLIFSTTKMNFFLYAFISLPVLLNLDFLLTLWLKDFPPLTIPFIQAIIAFLLFDVIQQPLWTTVYATGNIKTHEIMMASIKALVIPVTFLLLKWGKSPVITLYVWVLSNILCAVVRTIYCRSLFGLPLGDYSRRVILPLVAVTLLASPLPLWVARLPMGPWTKLIIITLTWSLNLLLIGFFIGLDRTERFFVLQLAPVRKVIELARKVFLKKSSREQA